MFDVMIVVAGGALLVLYSQFSGVRAKSSGVGGSSVILGVYFLYLGCLFLLSYFFAKASFILGLLRRVCVEFSHPRSPSMALVYFTAGTLVGTYLILRGCGVL